MSVSFKEGLKIPAPVMDQIIVGANQDIRQVNLFIVRSHIRSLFLYSCFDCGRSD